MISTFTGLASPILVFLLYFLSLGRYHTAMYTAAHVEHKWTKMHPIHIVRQCICFTLIELFCQISLKAKIPKLPLSTSLGVFPPKHIPPDHLKYAQMFV